MACCHGGLGNPGGPQMFPGVSHGDECPGSPHPQAPCDSVTGHYPLETFPGRDLAGSWACLNLHPHSPLDTLHSGSQPLCGAGCGAHARDPSRPPDTLTHSSPKPSASSAQNTGVALSEAGRKVGIPPRNTQLRAPASLCKSPQPAGGDTRNWGDPQGNPMFQGGAGLCSFSYHLP